MNMFIYKIIHVECLARWLTHRKSFINVSFCLRSVSQEVESEKEILAHVIYWEKLLRRNQKGSKGRKETIGKR